LLVRKLQCWKNGKKTNRNSSFKPF
jgi:hypothetical protein